MKHEYVRLVEAYREGGKNKQRVVCNLGRKELLEEHLDGLSRLLRGESTAALDGVIGVRGAWDWGPMIASRSLWNELGLGAIVEQCGAKAVCNGMASSEQARVLVTHRLCNSTSEYALAGWLETDYVCDDRGRRWRARPRRGSGPYPGQWYQTLEQLYLQKNEIEEQLYRRLGDLVGWKGDPVLHRLTLEGDGSSGQAAGKVEMLVVLADGCPIAHRVFSGRERNGARVSELLNDLVKGFDVRRVRWVGYSAPRQTDQPQRRRDTEERIYERVRRMEWDGKEWREVTLRGRTEGKKEREEEIWRGLDEMKLAFSGLQDALEGGPLYERVNPCMEAQIFVAMLALLLRWLMEKKLAAAGLNVSAAEALQALRTVRLVELVADGGKRMRCVTRGTDHAAAILKSVTRPTSNVTRGAQSA